MTALPFDPLAQRAQRLGFHGLVAQWGALGSQPWVPSLLELEEAERTRRSLERRRQQARLKNFHPLADFDWGWPRRIDRAQVEDAFTLDFLKEAENIILLGPNGVGKTMIGHNLLHHALLRGHTVLCTTASAMLSDLAQRETAHALQVGFRRYARPQLLLIDEVGYLSYDNRHADLLFEVISRRYERLSTVITTNKPFSQWNEIFPNAACVVTLIDRLTHRAEIISIDADSYRLKEAKQRAADKAKRRADRRSSPKTP
jgi:DNA replication protein DnaC